MRSIKSKSMSASSIDITMKFALIIACPRIYIQENDNSSIEYINLITKYLLIQSELTALTKKLPLKQIMSKTKQARVNWVRIFNNIFLEITH